MRTSVPVLEILNYIRTSFDDETVLDFVPLEAAGNPSAWHAWKAHRKDTNTTVISSAKRDNPQARLPGDWNWDGIWIRRVQYEVEASRSDATLFGSAARGAADEMVLSSQTCPRPDIANCDVQIHFNRLDRDTLASVKQMVVPPVEQALE
jgi:hypothetical protein